MAVLFRYSTIFVAVIMSVLQQYMIRKEKEIPQIETKRQKLYFYLHPIALTGIAVYISLMCSDLNVLLIWRELIMLSFLWIIAYVDFRVQLIPNRLLLFALFLRGLVLICEFVWEPSGIPGEIMAELVGCTVLLLFFILLRFVSKKGLGMGDIKLFAILPLFFGVMGSLRLVIYSMLIIFVQSCICLLAGKKGRKDVLPFAPAILGGTWVYMLMSVF